jgi:hypothetical protein
LPVCPPPFGRYQKTRRALTDGVGTQEVVFKEKREVNRKEGHPYSKATFG